MKYLDTGARDPSQALAKWLEDVFREDVIELRLQTGFFSLDGVGLLLPTLERCVKEDRPVNLLIGSNEASTLRDDVGKLVVAMGIPRANAQLGIVSFGGAYFHPKTYHIRRHDSSEAAFVGSANLTAAGLALHVEAGITLDTREGDAPHHLSQIAAAIDAWFVEQREGMTLVTGVHALDELVERGVLALAPPPRAAFTDKDKEGALSTKISRPRLKQLVSLPRVKEISEDTEDTEQAYEAPQIDRVPEERASGKDNNSVTEVASSAWAQAGKYRAFLMTLQKTDVGSGQITKGTSRRSPEIFIPLAARNADPDFWGWPDLFRPDVNNQGKMDRFGVKMRIGTRIFDVNMMTWPAKHDFRLRSEQLRSAGNIGDILYLERSNGQSGFTYYVEVIPQGIARHGQYLALCVNAVRNSTRRWGYI